MRGKYLNQFEMQSYESLASRHELVGFASRTPFHEQFNFPVVKLFSPMDLPNFPFRMPILNRLFIDAMWLWGLEKKLTGFDIAHTAEIYYHFTQQCLEAKKQGLVKKVIATVWENIPFNHESIRGRKRFKKRSLTEIDHFLAITDMARQSLIKEGGDPAKITVIPMGVDLRKFKSQKLKTRSKKKFLEILFVGRLEEEKGIFELWEALRQLVKTCPHIKLTMVGDGSQKKKLVSLIDKSGLREIIRLIKVPYGQMPEQYRSADIFCLPSKPTQFWQEQFGMVLVEAMATGLPIVSTSSGAISEVVGRAGILVRPGSAAGLYRALKEVIRNQKIRNKLSAWGHQRAKELFDSHKVAQKIERLWEGVLGK